MAYKNNTNNNGKISQKTWLILGSILTVVLLFGKQIVTSIRMLFASATSVKLGQEINQSNNNTDPIKGTRTPYITGIVTTVKKMIGDSWYHIQDEVGIVNEMNKLANAAEVSEASALYQTAYSSSLRADLVEALHKDTFFGTTQPGAFSQLKDYIKNNLV